MTYASKIDMGEVTRLTAAGRLDEAMAMLRGETPAPAAQPSEAGKPNGATLTLNMKHVDAARPWVGPAAGPDTTGGASQTATSFSRLGGGMLAGLGGLAGGRGAATPRAPADSARFAAHSHAGPAGTLTYKLYIPRVAGNANAPVPLLVMLHGCTQSPDDFAAGTRMNELAEETGCLVVYPAQSQRANGQKCWNWFQHADQQRDSGEAALIAAMVREVIATHRIDPARVYVAGLSAGGAAAAILGQRHPDLFAAVGVHSGLACGAAADMSSAFTAMQGRAALNDAAGARPIPTIVFHGDGDRTVAPVNGQQVLDQAIAGRATSTMVERGQSAGGVAYTRTTHSAHDGGPPVRFESWILHGAGHAWSGGSPHGSYTDANGPDASREMLRFFAEVSKGAADQRPSGQRNR